jgi:hypothetical protein
VVKILRGARWALVATGFVVALVLGRGVWAPAIGRSLVCEEGTGNADVLIVDNLDSNYSLFKRAASLQDAGVGRRVLVATASTAPDGVDEAIVELMARIAHVRDWELVRIREIEPISLNAALQVRDVLTRAGVKSVALVTPGFRSRRSSLVYRAALGQDGIAVRCAPVIGEERIETWTGTWHGIQEVSLQFLKLQYYRFYVLPKRAWAAS